MGKNIEIYPMDHSPDSVGDDNEKATTVVADDWEETLKRIGGSQSNDWNHVLAHLWERGYASRRGYGQARPDPADRWK